VKKHVQIVAVLSIAWGAMGLVGVLILTLIFGGVMGAIGMAVEHDPHAGLAIPIVGYVGAAICLLLLVTCLPAIIAGIGLLRMAPWSRVLTIILSALHVFAFPIGTALGIYGLWVMFSDQTVALFEVNRRPIHI